MARIRERPTSGVPGYCLLNPVIRSSQECRNHWWSGHCDNVKEIRQTHSRAYCQTVNFPYVTLLRKEMENGRIIPKRLRSEAIPNVKANSYSRGLSVVSKHTNEEIIKATEKRESAVKRTHQRQKERLGMEKQLDKAAKFLLSCKSAEEVMKLMSTRSDINQDSIKNLRKQFKEGAANYGRVKMTCLNMLRGAEKAKANKSSPSTSKQVTKKNLPEKAERVRRDDR